MYINIGSNRKPMPTILLSLAILVPRCPVFPIFGTMFGWTLHLSYHGNNLLKKEVIPFNAAFNYQMWKTRKYLTAAKAMTSHFPYRLQYSAQSHMS